MRPTNAKKTRDLNLEVTNTLGTVDETYREDSLTRSTIDCLHLESGPEDSSNLTVSTPDDTDSFSDKSRPDVEREARRESNSPFRSWCYEFFVRSESWKAKVFYIFSHILLLLMVISFCLETIPSVYQTESNEWLKFSKSLDISLLVILVGELIGKFYGWPNRWRFFMSYKNLLDLIIIIPFFVVIFFESASSSYFFRVFRLLKVFTLLKIFRVNQYSPGLFVTTLAIKRSITQIIVVSLYLIVAILISSSLIFFVEQGEYDQISRVWMRKVNGQLQPSPFQSIVHSFYWSIVTLTTTGYGDMVPVTPLGKLIAGFTMICGIMVIALPTSIIGANLVSEWESYNRMKFQMEFKYSKSINEVPLSQLPNERKKKIKVLRHHNKLMMDLISEIQERLYDINPPHFYVEYKRLSKKYIQMKRRMGTLESELEKYKKLAQAGNDSEPGASHVSSFLQPFRKFRTESSVREDISSASSPRKYRRRSLFRSLIPHSYASDEQLNYCQKPFRITTDIVSGPFSSRPINQETFITETESNQESSKSQESKQHSETGSLSEIGDSAKAVDHFRNIHSNLQYSQTDHPIDYSQGARPKHVSKHTISRPFAPRLYSNYAISNRSIQIPTEPNASDLPRIAFTSPSPASSLTPTPAPTFNPSIINEDTPPEHQAITIDSPLIHPLLETAFTESNHVA